MASLFGFGTSFRKPGGGCPTDLDWLVDYLNTTPGDAGTEYDFEWLLGDFVEQDPTRGVRFDESDISGSIDRLTHEQRRAFLAYLGSEVTRVYDDELTPGYVPFRGAVKQPPGSWFAHFHASRHGNFSNFDRGTTIDQLMTGSNNTDHANVADCESNLTDDIGPAEAVLGFAFSTLRYNDRQLQAWSRQYGSAGILFQSDCAVEAFHNGDDQYQVLFLICSEYNAVPFTMDSYGGVSTQVTQAALDTGDDDQFDSMSGFKEAVQKVVNVRASRRQRVYRGTLHGLSCGERRPRWLHPKKAP